MSKRQSNTIIAGIVAVLFTQILCTAVLLRGQERSIRYAEAAQDSAAMALDMQSEAVCVASDAEQSLPKQPPPPVEPRSMFVCVSPELEPSQEAPHGPKHVGCRLSTELRGHSSDAIPSIPYDCFLGK